MLYETCVAIVANSYFLIVVSCSIVTLVQSDREKYLDPIEVVQQSGGSIGGRLIEEQINRNQRLQRVVFSRHMPLGDNTKLL